MHGLTSYTIRIWEIQKVECIIWFRGREYRHANINKNTTIIFLINGLDNYVVINVIDIDNSNYRRHETHFIKMVNINPKK
jgi:hypothetical protein